MTAPLLSDALGPRARRRTLIASIVAGIVLVGVADDGPGLAEEQLEAVFDPFVRVETSRSRQTGGAGLGLTIARALAEKDGARLWLRNRAEGGLEAVVQWPASAQVVAPGRAG